MFYTAQMVHKVYISKDESQQGLILHPYKKCDTNLQKGLCKNLFFMGKKGLKQSWFGSHLTLMCGSQKISRSSKYVDDLN